MTGYLLEYIGNFLVLWCFVVWSVETLNTEQRVCVTTAQKHLWSWKVHISLYTMIVTVNGISVHVWQHFMSALEQETNTEDALPAGCSKAYIKTAANFPNPSDGFYVITYSDNSPCAFLCVIHQGFESATLFASWVLRQPKCEGEGNTSTKSSTNILSRQKVLNISSLWTHLSKSCLVATCWTIGAGFSINSST